MTPKYVFSAGNFSVLWSSERVEVTTTKGCLTITESGYAANEHGMQCAVARCLYLDAILSHKTMNKAEAVSIATRADEIGAELFALGIRKAHKKWLDE